MKYKTKLDTMATVITVGIVLLFGSIIATVWTFPEAGEMIGASISTSILLVAILFFSYGFAPKAFSFDEYGIVVHRLLKNAHIPFDQIQSARKIGKVSPKGLIRTLGNGGLFGYYGDFRNDEIGDMDWYLTRRQDIVFLDTTKAKILLSPNDVDIFLVELNSHLTNQV
ncbi:PH domain-containing protein [Flavobacterium sp.]|uniref:PH domain-containing protein n=1 Tax=Flavobacterium sp. TaxID=239 RepID=UPI001226D379|nr:PH domain-containing protein [Flavobacterium sp.]RZJ69139.1 MAG: hypothetical protein EOO49_18395 [Flavobacterium sp.]